MVANRTPPLSTQIQPLSARSATPCRLAHSPLAKPTVRDRVKEDANPNPPLADVARAWPSCIRVQPLRPSIIITWGLLQHNNVTNCRLITRCQTSSTIVWEELVQYIMLGWFSKALLNLDWRHIETQWARSKDCCTDPLYLFLPSVYQKRKKKELATKPSCEGYK
jgi:hypothetical protein